MRRNVWFPLLVLVAALTLVPAAVSARVPAPSAQATLLNTSGRVVGSASFRERSNGTVVVTIRAYGLTPGPHGVHIHTTGACVVGQSPAFSSAGTHFNPDGTVHGAHAGDLGNLVAGSYGSVTASIVTNDFSISAGHYSIMDHDGSAIVIHAGQDDLHTDPTGNSGSRAVCGVIHQ
jgi:superoxide dismutase, Cu-Zn family